MPQAALVDQILDRLRAGVASSPDLERGLGVSQSSIARALRTLVARAVVLRVGSTRGARYGLRREVEGIGSAWPLRRVDAQGDVHDLGTLFALAAEQYCFAPAPQAISQGFAGGGVTTGLPYFLQDQRPGGFLGRAIPQRHPELTLPQRVTDWNDDHYLRYLTQQGGDACGDLILGRPAFDESMALARRRLIVDAVARPTRYPELMQQVMHGGLPGSSAHGEHPKFVIALRESGAVRHVLVKFSPPVDTPVGRRWSDLLVAEHRAHEILRDAGVPSVASHIMSAGGCTFLEVDRFDRAGADGRIGATSLLSIDANLYGRLDDWIAAAVRLHTDRRIDGQVLAQVRLVATFGALIANTDRHFGNLTCYDAYDRRFTLAPIYDMLPMLFAPEHDRIVVREFTPVDPTFDTLPVWGAARVLAEKYWRTLIDDSRISAGFHEISGACLRALEALPRTGAYAVSQ